MMDPRRVCRVGRVGRQAVDEDATECQCVVTVAIMRELSMTNAAGMHDQSSEGAGAPTPHMVELHMGDEESTLFPVLRRVARGLKGVGATGQAEKLLSDVATLEKQHGQYRSTYLAHGIVPPPKVLGPHGHAEDKIVSEYADLIRLEWQRMRAERAA